jgi:hypothetical protein
MVPPGREIAVYPDGREIDCLDRQVAWGYFMP